MQNLPLGSKQADGATIVQLEPQQVVLRVKPGNCNRINLLNKILIKIIRSDTSTLNSVNVMKIPWNVDPVKFCCLINALKITRKWQNSYFQVYFYH